MLERWCNQQTTKCFNGKVKTSRQHVKSDRRGDRPTAAFIHFYKGQTNWETVWMSVKPLHLKSYREKKVETLWTKHADEKVMMWRTVNIKVHKEEEWKDQVCMLNKVTERGSELVSRRYYWSRHAGQRRQVCLCMCVFFPRCYGYTSPWAIVS